MVSRIAAHLSIAQRHRACDYCGLSSSRRASHDEQTVAFLQELCYLPRKVPAACEIPTRIGGRHPPACAVEPIVKLGGRGRCFRKCIADHGDRRRIARIRQAQTG